jgi:hypothetical protein
MRILIAPPHTRAHTLSLPVAAHLRLKVGVPLASDVSSPTGPHFESRCLRRYAFCQRCPLCSLTSRIFRDNLWFSGMIWAMVAVSEHVSYLKGILVVMWRSDREDCEDFRLNRAWTQWHTHTGWIVSWFNQISQVCHHTHEHNYAVIKTLFVQVLKHVRFTFLYFSVLNRFISAIRMNKWPTVLLRLIRESKCSTDHFLCFQKLLKLTSPQITTTELFLWLVEQNVSTIKKISTGHNLLHYWLSFTPLSHVLFLHLCPCSCVYHTTLLIDTNRTELNPLNYTLMDLIS